MKEAVHSCSSLSSDEEGGSENFQMSLDRAFNVAGEFGVFQKRFFVLALFYQVVAAFHILAITFVGLEPSWVCAESVNDSLSSSQKCALYEGQSCTPHYTDRFHTIAQEVLYISKISNNYNYCNYY